MSTQDLEAIEWPESEASTNGAGIADPESSPFLPEPAYSAPPEVAEAAAFTLSAPDTEATVSPFIAEYAGTDNMESPEEAEYRETLEALFDPEFDEATQDMVDELTGVYEQHLPALSAGTESSREATAALTSYLKPLQDQAEASLDRMADEADQLSLESMTEQQIDEFFARFVPEGEMGGPATEEFFKKVWRKAKRAAKAVARVAKRGVRVLGKLMPIGMLLRKLRRLIRPLLRRVLRFAISRIPGRYRPLARRLARVFLRRETSELGEDMDQGEENETGFLDERVETADREVSDEAAASVPVDVVQQELNAIISGYVLAGEDFEMTPEVVEYISEEENLEDTSAGIDNAREQFVRELIQLEDGADATPQVEQFVMALMPALRLGIRIVGRRKVVNFLARYLSRLIRRYVGRRNAVPLSRVLVSAGLRLIRLEAQEEDEALVAAEVVAATVEETIENLLAEAPEDAFEDEEALTEHINAAFERAVSANFPPETVREELREAPGGTGAWVLRPGRGRKRYKKYTQILDVTIDAKTASRIRTFGGQTLLSFTSEQLGLPVRSKPIRAKMHIYQAIRGTTLSHIALLERGVPGLGSARRSSWSQIHPLTCRAAALLIPRHNGLCRKVARRFLMDRNLIGIGQRFFYLEIEGAQVRPRPGTGRRPSPARASEVNLVIDFRKQQLRVNDFLAESTSQDIATKLRRGASLSAVVTSLRTSLDSALRAILSGRPTRNLRIVREVPSEESIGRVVVGVLRVAGHRFRVYLMRFLISQLIRYMKSRLASFSRTFQEAVENRADGVTVVFTVQSDNVFRLFKGNLFQRGGALADLWRRGIQGSLDVAVVPGYRR